MRKSLSLAKPPSAQSFFLTSLAYMDVDQGRMQDAEALRLCESSEGNLNHLLS
jgi:hypothetical protein